MIMFDLADTRPAWVPPESSGSFVREQELVTHGTNVDNDNQFLYSRRRVTQNGL